MLNFKDFELDEKILKTIEELDYKKPTPIQMETIPKIKSGCDVIASAQTGTGKTAAFLLPLLHVLNAQKKSHHPRMLVLVPTRELALQIAAEAAKYSRRLPLKTLCIYGGAHYLEQKKAVKRPHDMLIATPGRLMDLMDQGLIDLSNLETLVLDEADRMLDMGFVDAVEAIAAKTPKSRQTLLFSATIHQKILHLSNKLQKDPIKIHVKPDQVFHDNLQQRLYYADGMKHKMLLLKHLLENEKISQAIIFIATKSSADALAQELQEKGYLSEALHGDMSQRQRTRAINKLRQGKIQLLIATDVAARGIDIPDLSHVINVDLPFQSEDYIHRIGRTGRAGQKGIAITFVAHKEAQALSKIQKLLEKPIETHTIAGLEPEARKKKDTLSNEKRSFRKRSFAGAESEGRRRGDKSPRAKRSFHKKPFSGQESEGKKWEDTSPRAKRSFHKKPFSGQESEGKKWEDKAPRAKRSFQKKSFAGLESEGREREDTLPRAKRSFHEKPFKKRSKQPFSFRKKKSFQKMK